LFDVALFPSTRSILLIGNEIDAAKRRRNIAFGSLSGFGAIRATTACERTSGRPVGQPEILHAEHR
jgi:hypothetical protein